MSLERYDVTIGLECHVQLSTKTKLFSPANNQFGMPPNTQTHVIDLGLPGVLPSLNDQAVEFAIRLGLALGCEIHTKSVFARKHYFYPDLPKGYQITQHEHPICTGGALKIQTSQGEKRIRLTRIHMEEDAGKTLHVEGGRVSYLDFNRAGTPLLEVVTEPDMTTAEEAMAFFKTLRSIVMYLGICDGNLQEGSMRADLNVSVRPKGTLVLGTRTETKNINSIRFLGQAVLFESLRQALELDEGRLIYQETRLWDSVKKETRAMRSKENAHDYRYFPDPDLPPLLVLADRIERIKAHLPELFDAKAKRYEASLGLSAYDASVLTAEKEIADYFEQALLCYAKNPKILANWVINDILRIMKDPIEEEMDLSKCPITPLHLAKLVELIDQGEASSKTAKTLFELMQKHPETSPETLMHQHGLVVEKDEGALLLAIDEVLLNSVEEVEKYKSGKTQVFGFLVGQVMKKTQGKADPKELNRLLRERLEE